MSKIQIKQREKNPNLIPSTNFERNPMQLPEKNPNKKPSMPTPPPPGSRKSNK
jgi:hypothetical protein